jgi:hypothetical protein
MFSDLACTQNGNVTLRPTYAAAALCTILEGKRQTDASFVGVEHSDTAEEETSEDGLQGTDFF